VKPLAPGGTIGVAAPASPYDSRSEVLRGVEWWESQGYKVKLAPHLYDRDDYVAGDAEDRAADLNALFADPEVDVVQALQGGYGSAQTIPYLDFDTIVANPKPLVGFSDITALHVAVRQRAGFPTVYGNGLVGVGDPEVTEFTRKRLLDVLTGDASLFTRADEVETAWGIIDPIIRAWDSQKSPLSIYEPGTWGPTEADELLAKDKRKWSTWDGRKG